MVREFFAAPVEVPSKRPQYAGQWRPVIRDRAIEQGSNMAFSWKGGGKFSMGECQFLRCD